jgi:hypothetical protein
LSAVTIGISSFALKWSFNANAELKVIKSEMENIKEAIKDLGEKSELDERQDSQISKFWRLHSWSREEINNINFRDNQPPAKWPDLGNSEWQ